jgi:hypothetical protein
VIAAMMRYTLGGAARYSFLSRARPLLLQPRQ